MANGEGGFFEKVTALLQWRKEGEEEALASVKKVEATTVKGAGVMGKALEGSQKAAANYISALQGAGVSLADMRTALKDTSFSAEDTRVAMQSLGYSTEEIKQVMGETEKPVRQVDWSLQSLAKSIQWAAYRFLTTLIIYQAFRKVLRTINEHIQEAIRLWQEFSSEQAKLRGLLEANQRLMGDQVGTLEEWNEWIASAGQQLLIGRLQMTKMAAAAMEANTVLGLSNKQLQDLVEMGAAVARSRQLMTGGELDYARGVELVIKAIEGQDSAMRQLGIRQEDMLKALGIEEDAWGELSETVQAQIRFSYIMTTLYGDMASAAHESLTTVDRDTAALAATAENTSVRLGEAISGFKDLLRPVVVVTEEALIGLGDAIDRYVVQPLVRLIEKGREALPILAAIGKWANDFLVQLGVVAPVLEEGADGMGELSEETQDAAGGALTFVKAFGAIHRMMAAAKGGIEEARDAIDAFKEKVRETEDVIGGLVDALWDMAQRSSSLTEDYYDDLRELDEDYYEDREDLIERYEERAADLRQRALDRIEDLQRRALERERQAREDLNLRLHQMEEDHLLDMKHLREQYTMDIEEAARARDAVAIRTLQRRYALQKRQREEDYDLQRHQLIESWQQRQDQNKRNLEREIQEIRDRLAEELAELQEEKAKELQELEENWRERQQELYKQYQEELRDLQEANKKQLADIIARLIDEKKITETEGQAITTWLEKEYGYRDRDIWNYVTYQLSEVERLRAGIQGAITNIVQWWNIYAQTLQAGITPYTPTVPTPTTPTAHTCPPGYVWGGTRCVRLAQFAQGGSFVTAGPQLIKVGEAGPELVNVIPLQRGGTVMGGMRNWIGGDFRLTIDGNQQGRWSVNFERDVTKVIKDLFEEAFR